MSDNKKYYWLKLKYSFFDQKEIKALRKIAGGDTFTIIYLKMQLRSLENDCKLFFEGFQEDFEAELADDINEDVENVKIVVSYLKQHGLIELVETEEGDEYLIHAAEENTGSETAVAGRVRKHRAKKLLGNNDETKSNPEKELEKSKSKREIKKPDKEKYLDFVRMTKEEHASLCRNYLKTYVDDYIAKLNEYIGSTGRRYKSHYFTVLSWMRKDGIAPVFSNIKTCPDCKTELKPGGLCPKCNYYPGPGR